MEMSIILAMVFLLLCLCVIVYFMRREHQLLGRIQKMLDDAVEGKFKDDCLDESKMSMIENSMWRYICDNGTAYKKLSEEKEQLQELVSNIAHQTVIPISNIMLYSRLIEEKIDLHKDGKGLEIKEEITAVLEEAEELDFLVEALVKLSRMETGIIHVNVQKQKISPVLAAVQKQFMAKAFEKNQRLIVEDTDETAVFDLKWTIEAAANVVDNAVKYTPCGGEIRVSVTVYTFFLCINVTDCGIGIEETEQAGVFTRFYRSPRVNEEKGVGIGLYLAREVMSAQGGYIKLKSKVNEGSTFSLFLPRENCHKSERL